jgi:ribosomal protein S18 acetylase RimI-like enzyme
MNALSFCPITPDDYDIVERMIIDFYNAGNPDAKTPFMTDSKVRKTIAQTLTHPDHLKIIVFRSELHVVGYAILSAFWSNEYGGLVTIIDELYVIPEYRNRGIGTLFIRQLIDAKETVALQLEVFHDNERAFALYKRLGFEIVDRKFMHKSLH